MENKVGRVVYVITAFNLAKEQLTSIGVYSTLQKAKEVQLEKYGNPAYNDGFTFFEIKEHVLNDNN